MPSTVESSNTSCYGKSKNRNLLDSQEEKKIFKTKVDILNCKPEDVTLRMEGNRVIIEGKLYKSKSKEKPVYFSKHYIMPENCELNKMRYTITPNGVFITAPRKPEEICPEWPKLEDDITTNCIDLKDKFEIRQNVQDFKPGDIKIKVNENNITIKAKRLQENGMKKVIKTYTLPENCEITKLERKFTPEGYLILTIPKFLGLFYNAKSDKDKKNDEKKKVKCKFNITSEKFEIMVDVSNFRPEDINIIQQKRMVTIEGIRCRKFGNIAEKFEKTFVPPSDYDLRKIDRKFHADGILVISIPRIEGKPIEDDFKTFLPENAVCDMKIKEDYVEIKLDIVGFSPEEIMIKVIGKQTLTIEGNKNSEKGKINKSFMKSYILPAECDIKKVKKHITSNGVLIVRIPRSKKTSSLENLADQKIFSNGTKNGSLDNLSEPDAMVDSAELDKEKFQMKFNVQGFETEDIYVKINKNIVTIECRHPQPGKGIIKSYLVPKTFNLNALQTYITEDDILVVTIPSLELEQDGLNYKKNDDFNDKSNSFTGEQSDDTYVIKVDIRGYNSNDIRVDIQGQNIIVQGGLLGNKKISRSFNKNFSVPPNYDLQNMLYYISAEGILIIEIPKKISNINGITPKLYSFPNDSGKNLDVHSNTSKKSIPSQEEVIQYKEYKDIHSPQISDEPEIVNIGGIEVFQIRVDVQNCLEKDLNVRIKGQNLRVEGKKIHCIHEKPENFARNFVVPDEFNMRGIKTDLQNGILLINIPKSHESATKIENFPKPRDLLSNVKIGQEKIVVEMDASGLRIEDFEITTYKNILTIEVLKNAGTSDRFKTKVDLPEDSLIDQITKSIAEDGKLLVEIPRKLPKFIDPDSDSDENSQFLQAEHRRSCLILSKSSMGKKSKSVKFLVDDFENDGSVKFATLPRSARAKSYNSLFKQEVFTPGKIRNTDENFELTIFVPHHEPDEVIVKIRGTTITIEGKKKDDKRNSYFSKNFFKTYIVPDNIDTAKLKTNFADKYLIITAPKKEKICEDVLA